MNDLGSSARLLSTASSPLAEELAWNLQPARRLEDLANNTIDRRKEKNYRKYEN